MDNMKVFWQIKTVWIILSSNFFFKNANAECDTTSRSKSIVCFNGEVASRYLKY